MFARTTRVWNIIIVQQVRAGLRRGSVFDVQADVVSFVTAFAAVVVVVVFGPADAATVGPGLRLRGRDGRRRADGRPYREPSDALLPRSPRRRLRSRIPPADRSFHRWHRGFLDLQSNTSCSSNCIIELIEKRRNRLPPCNPECSWFVKDLPPAKDEQVLVNFIFFKKAKRLGQAK